MAATVVSEPANSAALDGLLAGRFATSTVLAGRSRHADGVGRKVRHVDAEED